MPKIKAQVTEEDIQNAAKGGDFELPPQGVYKVKLDQVTLKQTDDAAKQAGKSPYLECRWKIIAESDGVTPPKANYGHIFDVVSFAESSGGFRVRLANDIGLPFVDG
jgi:hypothetical protein